MTLPHGYDTMVGELGDTLSGGERQRLGLARAFLHDSPLLLLDEPTSNLDSLNEGAILRSLDEQRGKRTVLLISHRPSTMGIADRTYEMAKGATVDKTDSDEPGYLEKSATLPFVSSGRNSVEEPSLEDGPDQKSGPDPVNGSSPEHGSDPESGPGSENGSGSESGSGTENSAALQDEAIRESDGTAKHRLSRVLFMLAGLVSLALGTVGVVLPILPTVPFYLLAAFCLAKGSNRLDRWFRGTNMYKKHLLPFKESKSMTAKAKLITMGSITALMAVGFIMMSNVPVGRIVLAAVWVFHVWLFGFRIKTAPPKWKTEAIKAGLKDYEDQ